MAEQRAYEEILDVAFRPDPGTLDGALRALDAPWRDAVATDVLHFMLRKSQRTLTYDFERVHAFVRVLLLRGARPETSALVARPSALVLALCRRGNARTPDLGECWSRLYDTMLAVARPSPQAASTRAYDQFRLMTQAVVAAAPDPELLHAVFWRVPDTHTDVLARLRAVLPWVDAATLMPRALRLEDDAVEVVRALLDAGAEPTAFADALERRPHGVRALMAEAVEEARARRLAVAMAGHPRLGAQSLLGRLDGDLLAALWAPRQASLRS